MVQENCNFAPLRHTGPSGVKRQQIPFVFLLVLEFLLYYCLLIIKIMGFIISFSHMYITYSDHTQVPITLSCPYSH
jgi:hypothetical protein